MPSGSVWLYEGDLCGEVLVALCAVTHVHHVSCKPAQPTSSLACPSGRMHSVADPVLPELTWLVVVGSFAAWFYGFGTGSNDVANAFGTSVGAKTLTLRQAVLIAAVFEFVGAMVLGRVSTGVIATGIADVNAFMREPEIFAYGMVCAMTVAGIWQVLASYLEYNVSSTHSIIGCIIGFALVYAGKDAVIWQQRDSASFPPYKGVVPIIVSWFFSPIFTAVASAFLFFLIRTIILRRSNSYILSFWLLPPLVTITVFVCMFFVFTKGAKKEIVSDADADWTDSKSAWVAAVIGVGCGVLAAAIALPILKFRADKMFNEDGTRKEEEGKDAESGKASKVELELESRGSDDPTAGPVTWQKSLSKSLRKVGTALTYGTTVNIHECIDEDPIVKAIHENAEVFDPKAEYVFKYLQVFSAICVVFAHGAGEVGYMAGPLAAIWTAYTEGKVVSSIKAPAWVVFIAAFGLVIGLATYGYNVTRAMGVRLAKLSATRGFCAELSTALVIMVCSQYGLPTSSSQVITGGIIGVGLMEGKVGINWKFFGVQFGSWVATLFISGLCTAALFAQGVYAPGKVAGSAQVFYEDQVAKYSAAMFDNYRSTLVTFNEAVTANAAPLAGRLTADSLKQWNTTLVGYSQAVQKAVNKTTGTADKYQLWSYLNTALSLYQSDTILTVGQTEIFPGADKCNGKDLKTTAACPRPQLLPAGANPTWP